MSRAWPRTCIKIQKRLASFKLRFLVKTRQSKALPAVLRIRIWLDPNCSTGLGSQSIARNRIRHWLIRKLKKVMNSGAWGLYLNVSNIIFIDLFQGIICRCLRRNLFLISKCLPVLKFRKGKILNRSNRRHRDFIMS